MRLSLPAPSLTVPSQRRLLASQLITLLTTPVVYLLLDKLRRRSPLERALGRHGEDAAASPAAAAPGTPAATQAT